MIVLESSFNAFDASLARDKLLVLPSELEIELLDRRGLERCLRLGSGCGAAYASYRNLLVDVVLREGDNSNKSPRPEDVLRGDCVGVAFGFDW